MKIKPISSPPKLDTVTGAPIEIVLSDQVGETLYQVFRPADGKLRVCIRQPTGFVEISAKNIEVLICKLAKMHVPYQT